MRRTGIRTRRNAGAEDEMTAIIPSPKGTSDTNRLFGRVEVKLTENSCKSSEESAHDSRESDIDRVDISREPVEDSTEGSRFEEEHRRAKDRVEPTKRFEVSERSITK
jgi:hypothetical protein